MRASIGFALSVLVAGCGNSGSNGGGGVDASFDLTAAPPDLTMVMVDLAPSTIPGTRVLAGDVALDGVTTDDRAIVTDQKKGLLAVTISGGMAQPQVIDPAPDSVAIGGKVVFSFSTVDMTTGVGKLIVWSQAVGAPKVLSQAAVNGVVSASADGLYIAYSDKASFDGATADLIVAKADGSGAHTIATGVDSGAGGCQPFLQFAGGKLIFTHCDLAAAPDGGMASATVSFADPATGNATVLKANAADTFSVDKAGAKVFVADAMGKGSVVSTAGMPEVAIDTNVSDGYITGDGSTVIYRTLGNALKRASVSAMPGPVVLVAKNVNQLQALSPDEKWVLFTNTTDNNTGFYDLFLSSATTPGAPVTLVANPAGSLIGADPFTADNSRAVFFGEVDANTLAGTLIAQPVSGGMMAMLGAKAWTEFAAKGTTVVFGDHYRAAAMQRGRVDVFVADTAKTDPPAQLVPNADADIFPNTAKDKLLFTISTGTGNGLYVLGL